MNRSFATLGLVLISLGYLLFWYLLLNELPISASEPVVLVWGVTGSIGLVLTLVGISTARSYQPRIPPRICIHCGRAISFNVKECPYCGESLKQILPKPSEEKTGTKENVPIARRLGKLVNKMSGSH